MALDISTGCPDQRPVWSDDPGRARQTSPSTDGRQIELNYNYYADTGQYASLAYQRTYHTFDNIGDGGSFVKVMGVVANLITSSSSTRRLSCSLYQTAAQTIPNNTPTDVTFGGEDFDDDNMHSGTSAIIQLPSVTMPGVFLVVGTLEWAPSGVGYRELKIVRHGASDTNWGWSRTDNFSNSGLGAVQLVFAILQASSGDTIRMVTFQNSGGSTATVAAGTKLACIHLW
jgi:hypothetical protein